MGCACGGSSERRRIVYVLHAPGKAPTTFLTQADANAAKTRAGGGTVVRTTQDPK